MEWRDGNVRLFMSHLAKHAAFVSDVKQELADYGIDGFVAHEDIEPSREWEREILDALRSCQALAAFLHEGFHESNWTDQEVGYTVARDDRDDDSVKIIPLRFDLTPYGFIGRYQAMDCGPCPPRISPRASTWPCWQTRERRG